MKPNLSQIGMGKEISVGGGGQVLKPYVSAWRGNVSHWCTSWVKDPFEKHAVLRGFCQEKSKGFLPPQPVRLRPAAGAQVSARVSPLLFDLTKMQ